MKIIKLTERRARHLVDRLFEAHAARPGRVCEWPVLGGSYVSGEDPIDEMKEEAVRALLARDWFAHNGPPDCQPLPLSSLEIEDRRWHGHGLRTGDHSNDLLSHIVAEFAITLRSQHWDFNCCPSFEDFACGMMATKLLRELAAMHFPDEILRLEKRYPPRLLKGLSDRGYFSWEPPKLHAKEWQFRQDDLRL